MLPVRVMREDFSRHSSKSLLRIAQKIKLQSSLFETTITLVTIGMAVRALLFFRATRHTFAPLTSFHRASSRRCDER
jgi:hypothetical protein